MLEVPTNLLKKGMGMGIVRHLMKEFVPQLSADEKKELLGCLIKVMDQEMIAEISLIEDTTEAICPRCGCPHTIKKGRPNGHQRYYCKGCGQYFSGATNRILGLTKLDRDVWVAYAREMLTGATLREAAIEVGVGLKTSFFMRMRICECMEGNLEAFRVGKGCSAEIDEYFLRESFKGNHTRSQGFKMPRKAKRRPKDGVKSGTSKGLICILTGINDRGASFLEVAARSGLNMKVAREILSDKVMEGAIISTDWAEPYKTVMVELGVAVHNRYVSTNRKQGVINAVNSLHARLTEFLVPFRGVSTRRLPRYLAWFEWIEAYRSLRTRSERTKLVAKQVANGYYKTRLRDLWTTPYPFGEYWGLAC
jgi:transposase-like protein